MKTKIVINEKYKEHKDFIAQIPYSFNEFGDTLQNSRNVIKKVTLNDSIINIKRFKKPILFNRFVYTFFRKPKAYKAYYNAIEIEKRGLLTATPISYIEVYKKNLLDLSYLVSNQLENADEIRKFYFSKVDSTSQRFLSAFAQYTAKLHEAGVLHLDYSPGNILFSKYNNDYKFWLVDVNRMKFCNIDILLGCKNFCRLFEYDDTSIFVAKEYAKARMYDEKYCISYVLKYKHLFEKKRLRKKRLKELFRKD